MLSPDDNSGEYIRLRAESRDDSLDTQDAAQSVTPYSRIHLPTTSSTVHYIPRRSGKYNTAWKSLIPVRKTKRTVYEVPLDKLGLFSYITSNWIRPFLHKSWNPSLSEEEFVSGSPSDSSDINGQRLKLLLRDEIVKSGQLNSSLWHVIWLFIRTRIILESILSLLGSVISILGLVFLLQPYFLKSREKMVSHHGSNIWIPPLMFIIAQVVAAFLHSWSTSLTHRTAVRLKSSYLTAIYRHLMQISVLNSVSIQQIVTMMASDSQRLFHAVTCIPAAITAVLVFTTCSFVIMWIFVASLLESSSCGMVYLRIILVDMAASLFVFPLMYLLAKIASVLKSQATNTAADRLLKLNEMLSQIRLIKVVSLEKLFTSKIKDFRSMECKFLCNSNIIEGFAILIYQAIPVITAMLLCYTNITTSGFIVVLTLLLVPIRDALHRFWTGVSGITTAQASLERLRCILLLDKSKQATEKPTNRLIAVAISNANFTLKSNNLPPKQYKQGDCLSCRRCSKYSYELDNNEELEMQPKTLLTNISFSAAKGKVIGICGPRGSGKTTLLLAILGHLNLGYGKVFRDGSFSYVSQDPWIWDATLRDNILFNEVFNHKRYYQVIHCCSLNDDIQYLPGGDQTKLDSSSLLLGQRQRVAVARALYAYRDICLFDDFLSALDEKLATEIFEKAILTHLEEKTVIITSQQIKFLSRCDEIYLLEKGEIVNRGSYTELLPALEETFPDVPGHTDQTLERNSQDPVHFGLLAKSTLDVPSVMVEDEDIEQADSLLLDNFPSSILKMYLRRSFFKTVSSASLEALLFILCFASGLGCALMKINLIDQEFNVSLFWIPIAILLMLITGQSGSIILSKILLEVSLTVHKTWLEKICRTSMMFFQETGGSDIMKWFSIYLHDIDVNLPLTTLNAVQWSILALLAILTLVLTSAWFVLLLIVTVVLIILLCHILRPGLNKLKTLEEESNVPLYTFVASTLTGRATIQAYGKERDYLAMFAKHCDMSAACTQLVGGAIGWLNFQMQIISVLTMAFILSLIASAQIFHFQNFLITLLPLEETISIVEISTLSMLILGIALQYAMQSVMTTSPKCSMIGQLDARIRNIELISHRTNKPNLPANWPTDGSIVFKNVKMKCWSHGSSASNGLTFTVRPNERVGIVGLPGSQHQFIVDILYHFVSLSDGAVYIGGTDISEVPLEKLRSCIAVIPHNPIFFSGSLRQNMDPEGEYTDNDLRDSLEKVSLWNLVRCLPGKLDCRADLLGDKLSVYEHRLIYVARAILKDPKVLVLEEPHLNYESGPLQRLYEDVKKVFTSSTVLIVAHNVQLVLDCQRVAVIKDGQLLEYDSPENLFKNSQSRFSMMVAESTNSLFETAL